MGLLLAIQCFLRFSVVLVHSFVGLIQQTEFILVLSNDLLRLFDRVSQLQLDHLDFFFVLLLIFTQLLLMFSN